MRSLLLADRSFVMRERRLLGRLEIGLTDEGVHVVRAAPDIGSAVKPVGFSKMLAYEAVSTSPASEALAGLFARTGIFGPARPARDLHRQLEELSLPGPEGQPVDAVHVFGEECWSMAVELAALCQAPLLIEVWAATLLDRMRRIERELDRQGALENLTWLAPNEALREAISASDAGAPVRLTPWGVHALSEPTAWSNDKSPPAIVIVCSGRDAAPLIPALEGIADAVREHDDALVFLDAVAMRDHKRVWGAVESLHLTSNLSIIPDIESRRELALRADVLVQPEADGDLRTITLDAMASGMTVVALRDPYADELIADQTAVLVDQPATSSWSDALRRVLNDPDEARRIGVRAHDFVRERRTASAYVRSVLETYRAVTEQSAPTPTSE